jgi:hypothetical protein
MILNFSFFYSQLPNSGELPQVPWIFCLWDGPQDFVLASEELCQLSITPGAPSLFFFFWLGVGGRGVETGSLCVALAVLELAL